ncbi:NADPH-dependent 2,4-dienoyl-CoA reductase/sulfur reductase-like enzyme/rhodanese-related sulfurtransferase [Desulfosalsimonas propionicica]|uniref:NADPH-dependent 2,4-dienoyl-CoA reductase/sulfur reductase-like enzyme/rhodanese-related sulfurtransferase n=1 Tax=Desulfosalsimonas propionicica TaxID=332175 RepID=A0A7W0CB52_9BACT|nr:FAD-dependent oxidoreductase [Desulfosalsimonas propionicica]MBA2882429.1 NADPH-dependent 2,4-dienoyl-CoA reductase/sulfur reductase-like enzyme/rhodanese-related sulfurtransferase [Desulfosalsimonas propionicica]
MTDKLVIVGGVAGGATAAARARRLNETAQIIVLERGPYISFANCGLPYYIGEVIKKRDDLLVTDAESFSKRYNVDVRPNSEVVDIDRDNRQVVVLNRETGEQYREFYGKLILSPGAEPIRPPFEGVDLDNVFTLRNIPDTDRIKAYVDENQPERAVVVGGGFIGLEMIENLVFRGVQITMVEKMDQVMPPLDYEMAALVQAHMIEKKVDCRFGDGVAALKQNGAAITVQTESGHEIDCDMVILSIGVRPETGLARKAGLTLGNSGGICVDDTLRTSDPHIYAVGDAVEMRHRLTGKPVLIPLAGPANKQGRIAADNVMGRLSVFRGTIGTSAVQVFEHTAASAGLNEKTLKAENIPYTAAYTHSGSHAGYYPGAETMAVKLLFSPGTGRLLGAQAVGKVGVDKRIDVLATAIYAGLTVFDLEELDLCYAPPYGSAKDPVNMAGYVGANLIKKDLEKINWNEVAGLDPEKMVLLDVRTKIEVRTSGTIDGAVHIPVDELRDRMGELDRNKTHVAYCAVGMRSYLAYKMLIQNGFSAANLAGGFRTYLAATEKILLM